MKQFYKELWQNLYNRYPQKRENMNYETENAFVNECFDLYEKEGFSRVFWDCFKSNPKYNGKPFKVVDRVPVYDGKNDGADIECLPMWRIEFEDGEQMAAYPEEIIPSEQFSNGYQQELLI